MPQEFQVLQCYSCSTFQVGIVKKVAKWTCKMCGEKQSVKKIFSKGNGKECRLFVQELNERRIKKEAEICVHNINVPPEINHETGQINENKNKWLEYTNTTSEDSISSEEVNLLDLNKFTTAKRIKCELDIAESRFASGKKLKYNQFMADDIVHTDFEKNNYTSKGETRSCRKFTRDDIKNACLVDVECNENEPKVVQCNELKIVNKNSYTNLKDDTSTGSRVKEACTLTKAEKAMHDNFNKTSQSKSNIFESDWDDNLNFSLEI